MNRRDRRAALARGKAGAASVPTEIPALAAEATLAYREGRIVDAEVACKQILVRAPEHPEALNILGVVYQASGNHRLAAKTLAKAIAVNDLDAACHYNIAMSYQAVGERAAAARHFKKAIALGLSGKGVEPFLTQNTDIASRTNGAADERGLPVKIDDLFDADDISAIADNIFLRCALETTIIRGVPLELFLTGLRHALLRFAIGNMSDPSRVAGDVLALFCALAQQCFLNEYIYAQSADETQRAQELRDVLLQRLSAGSEVPALLLAAVAAYFPLHALAGAESLLAREWLPETADLLRLSVREPLEEAADRPTIPALTAVEDRTSREVMRQYEENPYPRWTINPLAALGRDPGGLPGVASPIRIGPKHPCCWLRHWRASVRCRAKVTACAASGNRPQSREPRLCAKKDPRGRVTQHRICPGRYSQLGRARPQVRSDRGAGCLCTIWPIRWPAGAYCWGCWRRMAPCASGFTAKPHGARSSKRGR